MNQLSSEKRAAVIAALVEGNSIRSVVRMTGVAKNTVASLLVEVEVGAVCAQYQDRALRNLPCKRVQCDEIYVWESLNLGPNISGKLFQDPRAGGGSGYSIVVNAADVYTRKRFTVAHEIAHFILHRPQVGSGVQDDTFYRSPLGDAQERQANHLAAEILMPENLIRQLLVEGVSGVAGMASRLEVSTQAMTIRLGLPVV